MPLDSNQHMIPPGTGVVPNFLQSLTDFSATITDTPAFTSLTAAQQWVAQNAALAANRLIIVNAGASSTDSGVYRSNAGTLTRLTEISGSQLLPAYKQALVNAIYPVGCIIQLAVATNPGTLFGGTWSQIAAGRTLVGVGSNGTTSYASAGLTGGVESVTLTAAQSGLPEHTHTQEAHTHTSAPHAHEQSDGVTGWPCNGGVSQAAGNETGSFELTGWTDHGTSAWITPASQITMPFYKGLSTHSTTPGATGSATPTINSVAAKNATTAHENRMPYYTCYIWQRTA